MQQEVRSVGRNSEFLHDLWEQVFPKRPIPSKEQLFMLIGFEDPMVYRKSESRRNGMIVMDGVLRPSGTAFPGFFDLTIDGKRDSIYYGNVAEITQSGKTVLRADAIKIKSAQMSINPRRNEDLYIYMMLCPWNKDSPIHLSPEEQEKRGQKVILGYGKKAVKPVFYPWQPEIKMRQQETKSRAEFEVEEWLRRSAKLDEILAMASEFGVSVPEVEDRYNVLRFNLIAIAKQNTSRALKFIEQFDRSGYEIARMAVESGAVTTDGRVLKLGDEIICRTPGKLEGDELVKFVNLQIQTIPDFRQEVSSIVKAEKKEKENILVAATVPRRGQRRTS